jgi:AraC-like DNA-binding protein
LPYRIDLFAVFIFLGVVQSVFLSIFFLSKENQKIPANLFQGLLLLSLGACIFEIFLMYTGYIQNCFYLVDFSEPFSFVLGPCFYLYIVSLIQGKVQRRQYLHFIFPVLYLLMIIPFFLLPEDAKYNAWIDSYHPELPFRTIHFNDDVRLFWVTDNHSSATLISLTLYAVLGLVEILKAFRLRKESFCKPVNPVLKTIRYGIFEIIGVTGFLLFIKLFYDHDTGDHFLAVSISVMIYMTSFNVVRRSGFFKQTALVDQQKYKGSTIAPEIQRALLEKLSRVMTEQKHFLKPDFSLPELAQQLGTTVHTLSQVINEGLNKSFFEMLATYRVEEAKRLLKEKTNIKVEEIAEQVGYNSKSSFNTAFKKITGLTPSEYRNS